MYLRMKRDESLNIETVIVECLETPAFAGYSRLKGMIWIWVDRNRDVGHVLG